MTSRPVTAPGPHVIFDLDGTLVDSEPNYYEAGRRLLARYGVRDFDWEAHTRFIGIGTRETLTVLRAEYGIDAPVEELLAGKNALYLGSPGRRRRSSRRCGSSWSVCTRPGRRWRWRRVRPGPRSGRCSR